MASYIVWMLITASQGSNNYGTVTNIGNFKTLDQCQHVLKNIPSNDFKARCIQAEIVK